MDTLIETHIFGWVWNVNPYQLLMDVMLIVFALYVVSRKPIKPERPLSKEEIEAIIDEWQPIPLHPQKTPLNLLNEKVPMITGSNSTHVTIDGKSVLNLARVNFLGFVADEVSNKAAKEAVQKYGVGTCGPRGFYGTIDVHLELEETIKNFMKAEDAMIYSYGFATISSVIPAFTGQGDLLIVDKGVSYAVQTGVKLSRSTVMWFEHNNLQDLERVLKKVQQEDIKTKRKLNRRFIVIEGVYYNFGDVAPLDKIMELKRKYFYRIMMDDSYGIGVIGKTGRGTCEYFGVDPKEIDMLTGNLSSTVSSVGGFCCGSKSVIYHQRLNSSGYVYSASLPPLLTCAASASFKAIDKSPQMLSQFREKFNFVFQELKNIPDIVLTNAAEGSIIHFRLKDAPIDRLQNEVILQKIVDSALADGVLLTRAKYVDSELYMPAPSIRVCVCAKISNEQLKAACGTIKKAVSAALTSKAKSE